MQSHTKIRRANKTHGPDGQWAHAEILKLRAQVAQLEQQLSLARGVLGVHCWPVMQAYAGPARLHAFEGALAQLGSDPELKAEPEPAEAANGT